MNARNSRTSRPTPPRPIIEVEAEQVPVDETVEVVEAELIEPGTEVAIYVPADPNFEVTVTPPEVNEKGAHKVEAPTETPKVKKPKREWLFTPFQATKALNKIREAAGLTPVNSPMLYIYSGKGAFPIVTATDGTGRKVIADRDAFPAWANAHTTAQVAKKAAKVTETVIAEV
jgi:hypothetical protein